MARSSKPKKRIVGKPSREKQPKAKPTKKKPIVQYDHKGAQRVNNPPVGLVTPKTDMETAKKTYAYDPHLDPQLQWAGKAEHTSFEVPIVSLHVHERIDPRTIVDAVRKVNGSGLEYQQLSLFHTARENPPLAKPFSFTNTNTTGRTD